MRQDRSVPRHLPVLGFWKVFCHSPLTRARVYRLFSVSAFCFPGLSYTTWNEGISALNRMRLVAVSICNKFGLLLVDRVMGLSMILFMIALDAELIGGSALVINIFCLSGEF